MNKHIFVICAYGESPYIEECIQSLLNQRIKSRVIISSAIRSDYIDSIAHKYGLELFVRDGKPHICDDWNYGYNNADAEYVTIAHQDDWYSPDYTQEVIAKMDNAKQPIICVTDYLPLKNGSNKKDINCKIRHFLRIPLKYKSLNGKKFWKRAVLALGNSICCPTVTYNKKLLGDNVFTSSLSYDLDWDTFYILGEKDGSFEYVDKPLAYYRIHDGATSKEFINNHKRIADDEFMFGRYYPRWIVKLIMIFYKRAYNNYDD